MDAPTDTSRLSILGQRLRAARRELGLSQEALAQPEFTKSYVSAVERGKVRPSLKALDLLSRRLNVSMSELLAVVPAAINEPDVAAMEQDLEFQLAHARILVNNNQAAEGIRLLNQAERDYRPYLEQMKPRTQLGIPHLRAIGHLRLFEPGDARRELAVAMKIAQDIPDGAEDVERIRNLIGLAYFQQDTPHLALEHHRQCLEAIHKNVVKDLNLKLTIYNNLAGDYWALGDAKQAIGIYKEGLTLLNDTAVFGHQVGLYWGLSSAYKASGDLDHAKMYAGLALSILESKDNLQHLAQMNVNMAEILIQRGEYTEAALQLERAKTVFMAIGDPVDLAVLYEAFSALELARAQYEAAVSYARESLAYSERAFAAASESQDLLTRANLRRTYARSLRTTGTAEHKLGNYEQADKLFERALELLGELEYDETTMETELAYANLLAERGAHDKASRHYQAAFSYRSRRAMR